MSKNEKRSQFVDAKKSNTRLYLVSAVAVIAIVVGGSMFFKGSSTTAPGTVNVGAVEYQKADFASISAEETGDNVTIDLKELKDKKTVTFNLKGINFTLNNGTPFDYLPLMAYVSPKGNIVVATSLCEPCSGTTFHVENGNLICNTCGTTWSLDGLQAVSGGCTTYPPETVKYTIQGDKLIINKAALKTWKPRQV